MQEDIDTYDGFFSTPEIKNIVLEAINQFATGAETITLEELKTKIAQAKEKNDARVC